MGKVIWEGETPAEPKSMDTFLCEHCKLAYEIGGYVYWELDGRCEQLVCRKCGTMHRLEETVQGCQLLSLPGPATIEIVKPESGQQDMAFWEFKWSFCEADWQPQGLLSGAIKKLQELKCVRCADAILVQDDKVFREIEICPRCSKAMTFLYHTTVN